MNFSNRDKQGEANRIYNVLNLKKELGGLICDIAEKRTQFVEVLLNRCHDSKNDENFEKYDEVAEKLEILLKDIFFLCNTRNEKMVQLCDM